MKNLRLVVLLALTLLLVVVGVRDGLHRRALSASTALLMTSGRVSLTATTEWHHAALAERERFEVGADTVAVRSGDTRRLEPLDALDDVELDLKLFF